MPTNPLNKKHHDQLIKDQKDLHELEAAIGKAIAADVPGMDEALRVCKGCQAKINKLKAVYFPEKV